jgi:hypothetical protein
VSLRSILHAVSTAFLIAVVPMLALNPQPLPPGLDVLIGL